MFLVFVFFFTKFKMCRLQISPRTKILSVFLSPPSFLGWLRRMSGVEPVTGLWSRFNPATYYFSNVPTPNREKKIPPVAFCHHFSALIEKYKVKIVFFLFSKELEKDKSRKHEGEECVFLYIEKGRRNKRWLCFCWCVNVAAGRSAPGITTWQTVKTRGRGMFFPPQVRKKK